MKKKQVWRYYCEFCGKSNCSGGAMSTHEKHCTMNPNRVCRLCLAGDCGGKPLAELIAFAKEPIGDKAPSEVVKELLDLADGCPACTLAALRQAGRTQFKFNQESGVITEEAWPFDYKTEAARLWAEINQKEYEADCRSAMYS